MYKDAKNENIFVIGDVHGCFYTLQNLVARLPKDAELIFVGDLCDKGNFTKEVINFIMQNNHRAIKGNHDFLMQTHAIDALLHDIDSPWSSDKRYGGVMTLENYQEDKRLLVEHTEWIKSLPTYIQIDHYFITHGFALPFYEHRNDPAFYKDFLLNRYEAGMEIENDLVINIFGHCVFDEVISSENFCGIDTGCAYGKKLTAVQLGTMNIIQEQMDQRDSNYNIKELKLNHITLPKDAHTIENLRMHIDMIFTDFDLISTEVAEYIVQQFGEVGKNEIRLMLDKKQLFMKQAKKVL